MVIVEKYNSPDRDDLMRAFSDSGKYIVQDETDEKYSEAVYPVSTGRTFHEIDEDIPVETEEDNGIS